MECDLSDWLLKNSNRSTIKMPARAIKYYSKMDNNYIWTIRSVSRHAHFEQVKLSINQKEYHSETEHEYNKRYKNMLLFKN